LGNGTIISQENDDFFFQPAGADLPEGRVALENGQWPRMLLRLAHSLIGFGGMR